MRQDWIEGKIADGLEGLLETCTTPKVFAREVNDRLRKAWEGATGSDSCGPARLEAIERKIENVRQAVEDGLDDAAWANERLSALKAEREQLLAATVLSGEPPLVDAREALSHAAETRKVLEHGSPKDRKQMLRQWVEDIKLAPEALSVEAQYQLPEPVMNDVVAGAGFEPATFRL